MSEDPKTWTYGVTATPARFHTTLPKTLKSLRDAGFHDPRVFVDGGVWQEASTSIPSSLQITHHQPAIQACANWFQALWELYWRDGNATYYALFQDDILVCSNLKEYLERCSYPKRGFWNLILYPRVEEYLKIANADPIGWHETRQHCRGAQGLVFSRDAVCTLLSSKELVTRPQCREKRHRNIDGLVMNGLKESGFKEYAHYPSLIYHFNGPSMIGNKKQPKITSFEGEEYNPLSLLS